MTSGEPDDAHRPERRDLLLGNSAALVTIFVWGTIFPLVEQLLRHWDIFSTTAARQLIGSMALLTLLALRQRQFPLRRTLPWRHMIVLGFFGPVCSSTLTTLAVSLAGSVAVAIIYATGPIIAAVTSWVAFRVPLQPGIVIGIVFACVGGVILTLGRLDDANFTGGEGFMVLSLISWTWYSVACQRLLKGFSQLEIAAFSMLPGGLILTGIVIVLATTGLYDVRLPINLTTIALALFIGIVPIGIGNLTWHTGVSRLGVTMMAIYVNFVPVIAVLIAMAFGARPTLFHLFGGVVIMIGVLAVQIRALRDVSR
ncbi:MAG: DMT family transporter [Pseudomonadota bacterium]